jgi:thymidylate synthase
MDFVKVDAFDLDDAWFKLLCEVIDHGHVYTITRGSYEGQKRLEFDVVFIQVEKPGHQIIPIIPEGMNIPPPTSMEYVDRYMSYILSAERVPGEDYTYGERLVFFEELIQRGKATIFRHTDQIKAVIEMYKEGGYGTNQACMEIGIPSDLRLESPPCLRLIDTRIRYGKLHFFCYFRSWDLWGGLPSNLAAIQKMKEFMAEEIGVEDGQLMAASKGLHLYDHVWALAELRTGKRITLEGRKQV